MEEVGMAGDKAQLQSRKSITEQCLASRKSHGGCGEWWDIILTSLPHYPASLCHRFIRQAEGGNGPSAAEPCDSLREARNVKPYVKLFIFEIGQLM